MVCRNPTASLLETLASCASVNRLAFGIEANQVETTFGLSDVAELPQEGVRFQSGHWSRLTKGCGPGTALSVSSSRWHSVVAGPPASRSA
jgi:hypothetical protein